MEQQYKEAKQHINRSNNSLSEIERSINESQKIMEEQEEMGRKKRKATKKLEGRLTSQSKYKKKHKKEGMNRGLRAQSLKNSEEMNSIIKSQDLKLYWKETQEEVNRKLQQRKLEVESGEEESWDEYSGEEEDEVMEEENEGEDEREEQGKEKKEEEKVIEEQDKNEPGGKEKEAGGKEKGGGGSSQDIFLTQAKTGEEQDYQNMSSQNAQVIGDSQEQGEKIETKQVEGDEEKNPVEISSEESSSRLEGSSSATQDNTSSDSFSTEDSDSIRSSTPREGRKDFAPDVSRESTSSMKLRDRNTIKKPDNIKGRATDSQVDKAINITASK